MSTDPSPVTPPPTPRWEFLTIISVAHSDRVQCQCKGCGHTIYANIHMVRTPDGDIQCWGSTCFARESGQIAFATAPLYPSLGGRKLTDDERAMLLGNREVLIARFKSEYEASLAAERRRREAAQVREQVALPQKSFERDPARAFIANIKELDRQSEPPQSTPPRHHLDVLTPPKPVPLSHYSSSEPMNDPAYREIRERLAEKWKKNGIDVTKPHHHDSLIDNAMAEYRRKRR